LFIISFKNFKVSFSILSISLGVKSNEVIETWPWISLYTKCKISRLLWTANNLSLPSLFVCSSDNWRSTILKILTNFQSSELFNDGLNRVLYGALSILSHNELILSFALITKLISLCLQARLIVASFRSNPSFPTGIDSPDL